MWIHKPWFSRAWGTVNIGPNTSYLTPKGPTGRRIAAIGKEIEATDSTVTTKKQRGRLR